MLGKILMTLPWQLIYVLWCSDARSAQVVDERIRPALESGASVGSKKPTLLIVDEIDGATGGGDNVNSSFQKGIRNADTNCRQPDSCKSFYR
jgi:hypothetical protein